MCGSTDIVRQNGVFVCQSCGTKYSVEDAKRMIVKGKVDVSGSTVKIDTSDEFKNLYKLARRAKDENNAGEAAKYYEKILAKDPNNWEANFYTVYFQAMLHHCPDTLCRCIGKKPSAQYLDSDPRPCRRRDGAKERCA